MKPITAKQAREKFLSIQAEKELETSLVWNSIDAAIEAGCSVVALKATSLTEAQASILRKKYGYKVEEQREDTGDYHRSCWRTIGWVISW